MLTALRIGISTIRFSRNFTTSLPIHDISRIPIKLPRRRNTRIYAFLERFRTSLLIDTEKLPLYAAERANKSGKDKMPKAAFYAVKKGRKPGIYPTWIECEQQTKGHAGAIYKKFPTLSEAEVFIGGSSGRANAEPYSIPSAPSLEKGPAKKSKGYYAVKVGLKPGIYNDWAEAEPMVKGVHGAVYKRVPTVAAAEDFVNSPDIKSRTPHSLASSDKPSETIREVPERATEPNAEARTFAAPNVDSEDLDQHRELARSQGFTITDGHSGALVVYTDGSSLGNGKHGASAGSGIWWADKGHARTLNLAERLPGQLQTNNRAELLAIIRALESCPFPQLPLEIRTDSQYSISCITQYLPGWIKNDFRSSTGQPVKNKDMIVHLLALLNQRGSTNGVRFVHVRAHRGEVGNEGADVLANTGAARQQVPDRTDWFTLEDANHFTASRHQSLRRALKETASASEEPVRGKKKQRSDFVASSMEDDIMPVEIEVDPSWLLTPEEMAALDVDQDI